MGCNCGGGGTGLGNYEVKDASGKVIKTFGAVRETEAKAFAAKVSRTSLGSGPFVVQVKAWRRTGAR
jgi:hypothetical protein